MGLTVNIGSDHKISQDEWKEIQKVAKDNPNADIELTDGTKTLLTKSAKDLQALTDSSSLQAEVEKSGSGDGKEPNVANAEKELKTLETQMKDLQTQIANAEKAKDMKTKSDLQEKLAQMIFTAEEFNKVAKKKLAMGSFIKSAGDAYKKPMSGKAQIASGSPQAQAGQAGAGGSKAQSAGGYSPAGWGAQTWSGGSGVPMFSTDAYMKTMAMEDNVMSSWESVNKNTSRGKQLMMLFFYFARMAESGSMDAMYQFMKFITYIISKDKAKQQIEMGKKLIQLQELSRSWTNKLLNVETNTSDPAASNELMKTMTIVKSETDAIATSQKLISQMMEEFAQVVETLTNTTKAALETAGRIKRTVSTMR